MTAQFEVYRCLKCGNIVEVLHAGAGALVCCGDEMKLQKENTSDGSTEKHVPVVDKLDGSIKAKVGSVAHPMEDKHYIEWIEVIMKDGSLKRQFLKPGQTPEADFCCVEGEYTVREYCNLHGLWKAV